MHPETIDGIPSRERAGATASVVDFVEDLAWADLSAEVRHAVRRHLLDTIGVMIAGASGTVATQAEAALSLARGPGEFPVPGRKRRADLLDAIFLAATAGHGIELDDGYRQGSVHPGVVVAPALLPFAAQAHLSGTALLESMVAGYEVVLAVARAAHPALRLRGFHPTAASGVFGAAAGVAKLRGLSRTQLRNAFGIAASSAAGLFAFLAGGGDIKRLHAGHAAREGAFAALLAEQGVEGPPDILEGRDGFFQAFSEASKAGAVSLPPATPFAVTDCYVKPYACCRHLQPAIEALITLMAEEKLSAADIKSIDVDTYRIAAAHAHTGWSDFATAQLSFPFTMAVAARYGWIELAHFEPEVRSDPFIADIAARLSVHASEEVDRLYPRLRPARVTVVTTDGKSHTRKADEALGSAIVPFDDDRLKQKFLALAEPVLGPQRTRRVLEQAWSIEEIADIAPFIGELAL
jgi:2-methylcitrate dehydratase PrpD